MDMSAWFKRGRLNRVIEEKPNKLNGMNETNNFTQSIDEKLSIFRLHLQKMLISHKNSDISITHSDSVVPGYYYSSVEAYFIDKLSEDLGYILAVDFDTRDSHLASMSISKETGSIVISDRTILINGAESIAEFQSMLKEYFLIFELILKSYLLDKDTFIKNYYIQ